MLFILQITSHVSSHLVSVEWIRLQFTKASANLNVRILFLTTRTEAQLKATRNVDKKIGKQHKGRLWGWEVNATSSELRQMVGVVRY
jgi:hypothetical protein